MTLLVCLALTAAGTAAVVAALPLESVATLVTGFWVLLTAQLAAETLVVGAVLRELRPFPLGAAAVAVAVAEVAACVRFRRLQLAATGRRVVAAAGVAARRMWRHPLVLILLVLVVAQYAWQVALSVSLPASSFDSLWYHLIGPDTWIQHGAIVHSRQALFSDVYPQDQELLTAWVGTFVHHLRYAGLTNLPFVAMAVSSVVMLARNLRVRASLAVLAGLGFVAMPALFLQASTAYVDVAAGACALCAVGFLLVAPASIRVDGTVARGLAPHYLLAGAACGLAIGVKSSDLVVAAFVPVVAFVQFVRITDLRPGQSERPDRPRARVAGACLAIPVVVLGSFWYARTWVTWKSPFYPVAVLGFTGQGSTSSLVIGPNKPPELRHTPLGQVGAAVKSWVYDLHRHSFIYDQRLGGFGLQWPLLVVPALVAAAVWFARHRPSFLLGLVGPAVAVALASAAAWWARYTIMLAGVGCVAVALGLERLSTLREQGWRGRRGRGQAALAPLAATAFVAATGLSMWWATSPTDYPSLVQGKFHQFGSIRQVADLMGRPDRLALAYPWFAYTALDRVVPDGSTLAFVEGEQPFTHPLVGQDLQRRLVTVGTPQTVQELIAVLHRRGVHYVLLSARSALSALVSADPAQFLPLTTQGAVNGGDVFNLGLWPTCTNPALDITARVDPRSGALTVAGRYRDSCGPATGVPVDLYAGDLKVPVYRGSDRFLTSAVTGGGGVVVFTVPRPPQPERLFLRSRGQVLGTTFHAVTASPIISSP